MVQQSQMTHSRLFGVVRSAAAHMVLLALAAGVPLAAVAQGVAPRPPTPPAPPAPPAAPAPPIVSVHISRPEGYIGIVYSGTQRVQTSERRHDNRRVERTVLVSYTAYPAIVSVEPGSPAERAGLSAGDTVLSYNGRDVVAEPFPLHDMLRPGARLDMRVRRNGAVRNVAVTVGRRPGTHVVVQPGVHYSPSPEIAAEVRREVEGALAQARREMQRSRRLTNRQREEIRREADSAARARAALPTALLPTPMLFTTASVSAVAGAETTPLNDDLAGVLGVRRGVFVLRVNPGTPAAQSGLRGGDVITAVGDSTVTDLSQLRRAINAEQRRIRAAQGERAISLRIVRNKRNQRLTLRY
jgi:C-terminal processing protease CtpA/Prc